MLSPTEQADHLSRRQARMLPLLAVILITQQGAFIGGNDASGPGHVRIAAWLVMAILMVVVLATGGGFTRSREVRALLNDETTRAHRARALSIGFMATMATMATGIVLYGASLFEPLPGRSAVHVMMTVGIAAALIAFAAAERRALR